MTIYRTKEGSRIDIRAHEIPGTVKRGDSLYYPVGGQLYRVESVTFHGKYGFVPVLDLPVVDVPRSGSQVKRA